MRPIFLALCFALLNANKLTFADHNHEHSEKMYEELCGGMKKKIDPPGFVEVLGAMPSDGFRMVEGCGKTRSRFATLAKPGMEFKTDADYDNMCAKLTFSAQPGTGNVMAFQMNVTWSSTKNKDKGVCDIVFKSSDGKKSDKAWMYLTLADVKAKLFMGILCFHETKELGWVAASAENSLTPEKQKMVDDNLTLLGFTNLAAATVKMYGEKCT